MKRSPAVGLVGLWPDSVGHGQIRGKTARWSRMFGSAHGEGRGMRNLVNKRDLVAQARHRRVTRTMCGQHNPKGLTKWAVSTPLKGSSSITARSSWVTTTCGGALEVGLLRSSCLRIQLSDAARSSRLRSRLLFARHIECFSPVESEERLYSLLTPRHGSSFAQSSMRGSEVRSLDEPHVMPSVITSAPWVALGQ